MNPHLLDSQHDESARPWRTLQVTRHLGASATQAEDRVVEEWPVAIVFNGISHAVMMATPRDLQAFAAGFALSEGIAREAADLLDIEIQPHSRSVEVHVTLLQDAFAQLKIKRRSLAGSSGCGVCGVESLDSLDLQPARLPPDAIRAAQSVTDAAIAHAAGALREHQPVGQATGGAHAAAWCALTGEIQCVFEDVGRHNALDKLIGHLALRGVPLQQGFAFLSSRASYELVRKAARVGIPLLATISAPTSLAIDIAHQAGLRVASFCREAGFVEY